MDPEKTSRVFGTNSFHPADKNLLDSVVITMTVDGKQTKVDLGYVTLSTNSKGDTILTLDKRVMNILGSGTYKFTVIWADGSADCSFDIYAGGTPLTGDDSNIFLWGGLILISLVGLPVIFVIFRKNRIYVNKT